MKTSPQHKDRAVADALSRGLTIRELAEQEGVTYDAIRGWLNRRNVRLKTIAESKREGWRRLVSDMPPAEAVEVLLEVMEVMAPQMDVATVLPPEIDSLLMGQKRVIYRMLAEYKGRLVPKKTLYNTMYWSLSNPDESPEPKIVDVYICKLRQFLADHYPTEEIKTVWGEGYMLQDVADGENDDAG